MEKKMKSEQGGKAEKVTWICGTCYRAVKRTDQACPYCGARFVRGCGEVTARFNLPTL